jgi:subtilisin family serine protease
LILLAILALAIGVLTPVTAGAAEDPLELDGSATPVEKSTTGSYIVVMTADPLLADFDQDELDSNAATKKANGLAKGHDKALEDAGVSTDAKINEYVNALNGFSAVLSYEDALALAADKNVAMVLPDEMQQADTDAVPGFIGLSGPASPWQTGYDGEGVVVGIIDSGIWPEHPSFADDGSFPAPPIELDNSRPSCEFGNSTHNPADVPFECNNKLVGARQMLDTYRALIGATPDEYDSARDDDGHGTHTASTAAGNADVAASIYGAPLPSVSGVAPRAHVIAYKGLGALGGFTSDLASAIDQAVEDGVDVINYSIGGGAADPGGDEIAFLFAASAGVFIATSAGNSGPGSATLGNPGTMPWMTTVGANTQTRFFQGTAELGNGASYAGASITLEADEAPLIDAEFTGGDLCVPGTLDSAEVTGKIVLCRRGSIARADKSLAVLQAGGVGMIMYNNVDSDNLYTDTHWVPSVHIDNTPGLAIKTYVADATAAGTTPTAAIVDTQTITEWPSAPSMTYFSSRGPNPVVGDLIKPDITAPGIQILAGNTPTPIGGIQGEYFQAIAGTSMSSPVVAGVYALIKQAHPDWSEAMAKSAIMTTAYQEVVDNDRSGPADPFDYGAGHVDPGNKVHKGSAFQPGLVYDAGLFEYAAFTCGQDWGVFNPGSCDFLESLEVPTDPSDLNYPSIGVDGVPGTQTITRTVTSVAPGNRTFTVSVEPPAGYDVTVEPSSFKLKTGESFTYEVTITNVAAPIGEWRHGSLTWHEKTGNYDVFSPISVNAALFSAPAEVAGTGIEGSTSFDVTFGYTGDYTATPHGLVANAPASGTICQDPDQTYPSSDDAPCPAGGVDRIDFPISGSAFVRWEMVIPGDDDIDLFLEDSAGNIVASSTSGGTDELIELLLPADDTYTMVVHGWSVPNEPLPYTLSFWDVPLASGGSLAIDGAPASAVLGATGTIDLSWSGLVSGAEYLGAVSHSDASGLMGLTLVSVDTP